MGTAGFFGDGDGFSGGGVAEGRKEFLMGLERSVDWGNPTQAGVGLFLGTKATGIVGACGAEAGMVFWFSGLSGKFAGKTQDQAGGRR